MEYQITVTVKVNSQDRNAVQRLCDSIGNAVVEELEGLPVETHLSTNITLCKFEDSDSDEQSEFMGMMQIKDDGK